MEVKLQDGRIVRRNFDQLRPHVGVSVESPKRDIVVDVPSEHVKEGGSDEILSEPETLILNH